MSLIGWSAWNVSFVLPQDGVASTSLFCIQSRLHSCWHFRGGSLCWSWPAALSIQARTCQGFKGGCPGAVGSEGLLGVPSRPRSHAGWPWPSQIECTGGWSTAIRKLGSYIWLGNIHFKRFWLAYLAHLTWVVIPHHRILTSERSAAKRSFICRSGGWSVRGRLCRTIPIWVMLSVREASKQTNHTMDWTWTEEDIAVWKLESFNDVIASI